MTYVIFHQQGNKVWFLLAGVLANPVTNPLSGIEP